MGRVLVIGANDGLAKELRENAALQGHTVDTCRGALEVLKEARFRPLDVVVTDAARPVSGAMTLVEELNRLRPGVRTILLAPALTDSDVVTALRAQVFACFTTRQPCRDRRHGGHGTSRRKTGAAASRSCPGCRPG